MRVLDRIKATFKWKGPQTLGLRWNWRKPEPPDDDPYAYVGAPKRPRTPLRSSAVALEEPNGH